MTRDNAMAESFFASLETELLDRHTWRTRDQLANAIFEWITPGTTRDGVIPPWATSARYSTNRPIRPLPTGQADIKPFLSGQPG